MCADFVYLASASPRRRQLLEQIGVRYQTLSVSIDESVATAEAPRAYVSRLAEAKADAGRRQAQVRGSAGRPVLAADTAVLIDGEILGKPEDATDAARMLHRLSGRTHRVITGVAVVSAQRVEVAAEATAVHFLTLSDQEIDAYVATGEPMDKAGAYAIQGLAARWIPRIEGCYFNVVGLPLALVAAMLDGCEIQG